MKIFHKVKRLRRHLDAFLRYWSAKKIINLLRIEYEFRRGCDALKGKPYVYVIDPTNFCNLKCVFCPTWKGELPIPKGKIDFSNYKKIIDEIKPHAFKVILYNWGEPFLHPQIIDIINYTHKANIAVSLSTNINYLPEGLPEDLVKSGIDHLILSVNGLTETTYLKYHTGGNFEKVLENINKIAEAKKRLKSKSPHIEFQFLVFKHNQHEVPQVGEFARKLGCDSFRISAPYIDLSKKDEFLADDNKYVLGRYKAKNESALIKKQRCFWLWRAMVINWNGDIDPCCGKNLHGAFANIFNDGLNKSWNNINYQSARRDVVGKKQSSDAKTVCSFCSGYDY